MNEEAEHKRLRKEKGKFHIDCSLKIFNQDEIETLEKNGHWFHALAHGDLTPFTSKQEHFVRVAQNQEHPETMEEKVWFKYQGRRKIEANYGDRLNIQYEIDQDPFYSRDMVKQLKSTMHKVITDTHKKD